MQNHIVETLPLLHRLGWFIRELITDYNFQALNMIKEAVTMNIYYIPMITSFNIQETNLASVYNMI